MPLPFQISDELKNGDRCTDCGTPLVRVIISHDAMAGNVLGGECPQCRHDHFQQLAESGKPFANLPV